MLMKSTAFALVFFSAYACADDSPPLNGLNILVLGESHLSIKGYLASSLPEELVNKGAQVATYGACGASAGDWLKTKSVPCAGFRLGVGTLKERPADIASTQPLESLVNKHHPNLLLVIMGDTMASYDSPTIPKSWVWQTVSGLTGEVKRLGLSCVWVGPPWGENGGKYKKNNERVKEFSDYLSTLVAPCTYIDSLTFAKMGEWKTFDGEHFDKWGYESWAKGITNRILSPEILNTIKH